MKIVFTGGGTGGHFYPLMAVAERVLEISKQEKLLMPKMYYFAEDVYSPKDLYDRGIVYTYISSGKRRNYFSLMNFVDPFKVVFGIFLAFFKLLKLYPDVIFSKGGYDALPTCIAGWLLRIPIVMHESDSIPGKTSRLIAKFADRIAVSYPDAAAYFDSNKTAYTGQPIISKYMPEEYWVKQRPPQRPNILISGGSQGSQRINEYILKNLEFLASKYNIIHQTGDDNIKEVKSRADIILGNYSTDTYLPIGKIDFARVYPYVDLVISRAGSSIFEYALWGIPTILIPLPESANNHQYFNAETARKQGFADVILEEGMSNAVLIQKLNNILDNSNIADSVYEKMSKSAVNFGKRNAANIIAKELVKISLRV